MGSINALVSSCGTANHLPHRRGGGTCSSGPRTPAAAAAAATGPSSLKSLPGWKVGSRADASRSNFTAQICKGRGWMERQHGGTRGNGARMRTWRRTRPLAAQHPLAGKRTAKAEARDRSQAEVDKHESQKITTPIYMRGEETRI